MGARRTGGELVAKWGTHRFHDSVSLYSGDGQTVYMDAPEGLRMASALYRAALSVMAEPFPLSRGLSTSGTCRDPDTEGGKPSYKLERGGNGQARAGVRDEVWREGAL